MKLLLLYLLLLLCSDLYSRNAVFEFTSVPNENAGDLTHIYNSLEITVNHVKLSLKNKKYNIKINDSALDTIEILSSNPAYSDTILTKLRSGEVYKFTFSPCSTFEIIPASKHEGEKMVRLISKNRNEAKLYFNSYYCFIDTNQVKNRDTTDYFNNAASGYCPYAVTSFQMCGKDLDHINTRDDAKDCSSITLYFSGNEMYTISYDYQTRLMTAKFDGYYTPAIGKQ